MRLASYIGTRSGFIGLGNILIRLRLGGPESHTEIMFEPGDGVGEYMPDGTCEPDADGALWHASSVGLERLPEWSRRRAGHLGGVRFKRIVPTSSWTHDMLDANPLSAARKASADEGRLYDWQGVARYLLWVLPAKISRGNCSSVCAEWIGIEAKDAPLFDPRTLRAAVRGLNSMAISSATD